MLSLPLAKKPKLHSLNKEVIYFLSEKISAEAAPRLVNSEVNDVIKDSGSFCVVTLLSHSVRLLR